MSYTFDIDTDPESAELLAVAREQLRETPAIRQEGFKQLKELIKQNPDLNFSDDEAFMEVILRCCHWYPESAIKLLRSIAEFRKEHHETLMGLKFDDEKKAFTEGGVINIFPYKDHKDRRALVLNFGKVWDPDVVNNDQIFRLLYIMHIIAQLEKSAQINGIVVILDFDGLSLKQIKAMTPASIKRLITFIQVAMPLRLKELHVVKQPFIFNMVWAMIKPFLQEKLKSRMFLHGDDMKKLHKFIPENVLPSNYGGSLPEINYSGKDWFPLAEKYGDYISTWSSFGFKK